MSYVFALVFVLGLIGQSLLLHYWLGWWSTLLAVPLGAFSGYLAFRWLDRDARRAGYRGPP